MHAWRRLRGKWPQTLSGVRKTHLQAHYMDDHHMNVGTSQTVSRLPASCLKHYLRKASMLLCPASVTHNGLQRHSCRHFSKSPSPCQNGTTSSRVPWMMVTGDSTASMTSMLQNKSPGIVKRKLKATRNMDSKGLWRITPATGSFNCDCLAAMYVVGPEPRDRPYL
jgi:hypothetical protein